MNTLINKLPFEFHIPGHQYCGQGAKLEKHLFRHRNNLVDRVCKEHDIAYATIASIEGNIGKSSI